LLSVKDNHPNLKKDIENYIQDEVLKSNIESASQVEKGHGRVEKRTAYIIENIE